MLSKLKTDFTPPFAWIFNADHHIAVIRRREDALLRGSLLPLITFDLSRDGPDARAEDASTWITRTCRYVIVRTARWLLPARYRRDRVRHAARDGWPALEKMKRLADSTVRRVRHAFKHTGTRIAGLRLTIAD